MNRKYAFILLAVLFAALAIYTAVCLAQVGNYPDKLWLHRVNSLEKMQEKKALYPNFEADIIYRMEGEKRFDITHEADTTFHLYLEDYLPLLAKGEQRMWLDIKNITAENHSQILVRLDSLLAHHRLSKDRFIVESSNLKALSAFTEKGFYTSYYVPFDKPKRLSDAEIAESCAASPTPAAFARCPSPVGGMPTSRKA